MEDTTCRFVLQLPDCVLSFILSNLHGLCIGGSVPVACRTLRDACGHEVLCQHVFGRDLAEEDQCPLPQQPLRPTDRTGDLSTIVRFQSRPRHLHLSDLRAGGRSSGSARMALQCFSRDLAGSTPARIALKAAREGRPSLLSWAASRAPTHNLDGQRRSALMIGALHNRPLTVCAALDVGCNLEQHHEQHGTALHMAAYVGARESVEVLCSAGADLEAKNGSYGQTPLLVACSRNHVKVVQVLLDAGADDAALDADGLSSMRIAEMMRSSSAMQVLRQHADQAQQRDA
mmetsp:Transcript_10365/g.27437  ORF Transcript_10365/g.27437 Transcript_10365/m.27437 type:complete len:288 (+) Transcript_10365:84-947(+)